MLPFPDLLGAVDDGTAAIEAPIDIRSESRVHGCSASELLGEHYAVLDRLGSPLATVGRRAVRRIAEQHHASAVPRRRDEDVRERSHHDRFVIEDQVAYSGNWTTERLEALAQHRRVTLALDGRDDTVWRCVDEQVHQVLAERH